MIKNKIFFRFLVIIVTSGIVTLILANLIGEPVKNFESRIYQKISGKKPQHFSYDSMGVPIVVYEGKLGKQYNTVTVAEHAIKWAEEKDELVTRNFFNCIQWLKYNYTILNDSSIIFLNYYDWPSFNMTSPWRSAMNQGRVMQAFIKAYQKTADTSYLDYARKSMNVLYTEVNDGGVTYKDSSGYWYEEYADDNTSESRVLNGMIVVLQGLLDYYKITGDTGAYFLFNQGVKAVKNTLHQYDNNGHSSYDISGIPANPWYHKFHIELLDFLYKETHDPEIHRFKQKWSEYIEPSYLSILIKNPTRTGVFAIFSIFIGVSVVISSISYFIMFRK